MSLFLTALALSSTLFTAVHSFKPAFPYGDQKVRGVNLGGWLVLEPWITPTLFDDTGDDRIIDEYTFGKYLDHGDAFHRLHDHWETWITEQDFEDIKAAGLNHVRLPIGYWAFELLDDDPYVQGQLPYLAKAIIWAAKHDLKVIVDLHGAPGSQNGFDNSGQKVPYPEWHTQDHYQELTRKVLNEITKTTFPTSSIASVIAPLNEPAGFFGQDVIDATRKYWQDGYDIVRHPLGKYYESDTLVLFHDAFQPLESWTDFNGYEGAAMDTHIYTIFSDPEVQMTRREHIDVVCAKNQTLSTALEIPVIVGEWAPAFTDCAKYLNGRGIGARYDGTYPGSEKVGSCEGITGYGDQFDDEYKEFLRMFWEAQTSTYEKGAGWLQWTWKAEMADDWSYQGGLKGGWIPKDPTERMYPDVCSK